MGGSGSKTQEPKLPDYPEDTVILHTGFGRGFNAPSLSPPVLKLETFLRVAKIPYQAEHTTGLSKKGKVPWIIYNKEYIDDSELCIRYLNKKFNINLQKDLTPEQYADMFAFRCMNDEFLYWCLSYKRFVETAIDTLVQATKIPKQQMSNLVQRFHAYLDAQGTGRHSPEDVAWMRDRCFVALNDKLGDKPYFFGTSPTEGDCAIFANLVQCKYQMPGMEEIVNQKYPKLGEFVDRMVSEYWPDWDECHTHGHTKTPTK